MQQKAKLVKPVEINASQSENRKYWENKLKELREQDPVANKDEIESIEMLMIISE